jgi:hypothetical protein
MAGLDPAIRDASVSRQAWINRVEPGDDDFDFETRKGSQLSSPNRTIAELLHPLGATTTRPQVACEPKGIRTK